MKRYVILAAVAATFAAPVSAQSLSVLLPSLTFPEPTPTPSTMNCASTTETCLPGQ